MNDFLGGGVDLSLGSVLTFYSGYKYGPQMLSRRTRKLRDGKGKHRAKNLVVEMRLWRTSVKPFGLSSCH